MTDAMHLLVTTTQAVWLLDVATGAAKLIDRGRGVYYGISFSEDRIFIACRQAEVGADRDVQANIILVFDTALRPLDVLWPPIRVRDVHQICYFGGTLFICSTYDDAIVCHHVASRAWTVWYPFGRSLAQDRHHINSIMVDAAGILLAGNRPSGWFARFAHRHASPNCPRPLGIGTHNVWRDGALVSVCSSDEGAFRSEQGDARIVLPRGWLRGFAQDRRYRYVGVSQNLVRGVRDRSDCMVLRLDAGGSIDRTYSFEGFGMLHDLRVVGVADASHNGIALPLIDDAVADRSIAHQTASAPICLT